MEQYISKSALVEEIEKRLDELYDLLPDASKVENGSITTSEACNTGKYTALESFRRFINTLEVKEVDEQKERMSECPYRQVGCTMYEGHVLECTGACSWVVDYPRLKELKAQKGEQ